MFSRMLQTWWGSLLVLLMAVSAGATAEHFLGSVRDVVPRVARLEASRDSIAAQQRWQDSAIATTAGLVSRLSRIQEHIVAQNDSQHVLLWCMYDSIPHNRCPVHDGFLIR